MSSVEKTQPNTGKLAETYISDAQVEPTWRQIGEMALSPLLYSKLLLEIFYKNKLEKRVEKTKGLLTLLPIALLFIAWLIKDKRRRKAKHTRQKL